MTLYLIGIYVFAVGLCIGSFLNVCIFRLPHRKSILFPRSRCLTCGNAVRPVDNIPVLSYLLLRGRCRHCGTRISPRYPIVELMTGLMAVCVYLKFGLSARALVIFIFIAVLIVITYIDLDFWIIPDVISLPGIPIFFLASILIADTGWKSAALNSGLGILLGGGTLWLISMTYYLFKRIQGMGLGDVKLLAMIGALIGWQGVIVTIFVSSVTGTLAGLLGMARPHTKGKPAIPFGPFLAIGAITYLFFGPELIYWYTFTLG